MPRVQLEVSYENSEDFDAFLHCISTLKNVSARIESGNPDPCSEEPPRLLLEAVVGPACSRATVISLLHERIRQLNFVATQDMVIVDPYFLPKNADPTYSDYTIDVLRPALQVITKLTIVTLPGVIDERLKADLRTKIHGEWPKVTLTFKTSKLFHDRFWINVKAKTAFVSGTSLNGLGHRYALLADMDPRDASELILVLDSLRII